MNSLNKSPEQHAAAAAVEVEIAARRSQWRSEEALVRQRLAVADAQAAASGATSLEKLSTMTGLAQMQAMFDGTGPRPSIAKTLDFVMVAVDFGTATFQGTPNLELMNPMGTVHGGWYATLLDSACACAVHSTLPNDLAYTTAEISVKLLRSAPLNAGPFRAIGQILHSGRQLGMSEARIVDAAGKLYAHASSTCLIFPRKKPT